MLNSPWCILFTHHCHKCHYQMSTSKKCITLPSTTLYEDQILYYVSECEISCFFRGVFMRDELVSIKPAKHVECGILNFDTHDQSGTHWVSWTKLGNDRFYFDSYGERPPVEILKYLKSREEYDQDEPVIKCNAVTVQHDRSTECGALSLYVIFYLLNGQSFESVIQRLEKRYSKKSIPSPPLKICL